MKAENDVPIEDNSIDVESDEVCEPPAACFIKEAEPKVSSILR
jgi:hypothetical protein